MSKCFRVAQLVVVVVGGWLVIKGFPILGICVSMMACWHRIFDVLLNRCAVVEKKSLSDEVRGFHTPVHRLDHIDDVVGVTERLCRCFVLSQTRHVRRAGCLGG